jgi:hypothetical protein
MPIKKISNHLDVLELDKNHVISIVTTSKKNHFSCTISKLCEVLVDATYTSVGYFNAHVSTHPFIGIHIVGERGMLDKHKDMLIANVSRVLTNYHERGNVRLK